MQQKGVHKETTMHARSLSGQFLDSSSSSSGSSQRFTLDELSRLCSLLTVGGRYSIITEVNAAAVVETLRSVAELMIWGDQHDASFFDFFLENQMMESFGKIMVQVCTMMYTHINT